MTKRIRDFGAAIGGRRKRRKARILEQKNKDMAGSGKGLAEPYSYMEETGRVGEEKGIYEGEKKDNSIYSLLNTNS